MYITMDKVLHPGLDLCFVAFRKVLLHVIAAVQCITQAMCRLCAQGILSARSASAGGASAAGAALCAA